MKAGCATAAAMMLAVLGGEGPALGHAPPAGSGVWWLPASAATPGSIERMVIRTNRGLVVHNASGAGWSLLCNEAIGIAASEEAPLEITGGGTPLVATFGSGLRSGSADLCEWKPAAGDVATMPSFDVTTVAAEPSILYLLAGMSDTPTNFFVSRNGGDSWAALATSEIPYTRIRVAPSDSSRVYRTGVGIDANSKLTHRISVSRDGGLTATELHIPLLASELQARVVGVDPADPQLVYVHVEANSAELPERLIVSRDGGQSFTTAVVGLALNGFVISDDGSRVWVGGRNGIWRSTDRGTSFTFLATAEVTQVGCLAVHGGQLFACGVSDQQEAISVSDDGGDSFRKFLSFSQVAEIIDCPGAPAVAAACAGPIAHWRSELSTFAGTPAPVTTTDQTGSGTPTPGTPGTGTSRPAGCQVASLPASGFVGIPWFLLPLWGRLRTRRSRARRRS